MKPTDPYRDQPAAGPAAPATAPPKHPKRLRWFWYPALALLGPPGWAVLAFATPRVRAAEQLAALPFAVTHDRQSGTDASTWRVPLASATIVLRRAPDGVEAEQIARAAEQVAPWLSARVNAAVITLVARTPRGAHLVRLADLLSIWGIALHETHGIVGVECVWRPRSGPPLSI